jgi:hypothetical protein
MKTRKEKGLLAVTTALSRLGAIALAATTIGCGAPEEGVESVAQALTVGRWSSDLCCGDYPSDPYAEFEIPWACETFSTADYRWHPGKFWNNTCRVEWADRVFYTNSYRILRRPATGSYSLVGGSSSSLVPENAVFSDWSSSGNVGLPLCLGASQAWGKVFDGTCRFEYDDRVYKVPAWQYLVHNP